VPTFTDEGVDRNIVFEGPDEGPKKSTLKRTVLSDAEVVNRVVVTLDDEDHENTQRPLTFEEVDAQLRAGRAFGDTSRRVVEKTYSAFGVTNVGEASRLGNLLLHLGEFDEGGTENNLRIRFTTWYAETLEVQKYGFIRVLSSKLTRYGFEYFRVRSLQRLPDLKVEISAQAYPREYYERLELWTQPPPIIGSGIDINPGGGPGPVGGPGIRPVPIGFDELEHFDDRIHFRLERFGEILP
jgi:hypothetical protein